ncbi:MAG TPA: hypothetical protein VGR89_00015 [Puia sp.]|nr:hypothetical protein [Puia sp.]
MNFKSFFTFAVFLGTIGAFIWGCQGAKPVTPYSNVALSVYLPATNEVKASLLGVASNELLYRVDGPGHALYAQGTVGPFSTAASSGSIDFSATVPALDSLVLSVQLNDASTHQPLAIGATGLDLVTAPVTDVVVDMGSVTRNCYTLNVSGGYSLNEIYTFSTDNLLNNSPGANGDFTTNYSAGFSSPLTIIGSTPVAALPVTNASVAYLGNGDFVDYDFVPPVSAFKTDSSLAKGAPVSLGDIFCLQLLSMPAVVGGGHAWIQVTNLGNGTLYVGPSFRYRVNSILPYFGYEQTAPDQGATCSTSW